MEYFVISPDGQKYGPADIHTLNVWAREGRVLPATMLENSTNREQTLAGQLAGVSFPDVMEASTHQSPFADYPRERPDDGSKEYQMSWTFTLLGLVGGFFVCLCFAPIGLNVAAIVYAAQALKKGHPKGSLALGMAIGSIFVGPVIMFTIGMLVD